MGEGFEEIHPPQQQKERLGGREAEIDAPEPGGHLVEPRRYFLQAEAGYFSLEEMHPSHADKGKYGKAEDDDPHASDPVGHPPPEEKAFRVDFDVREYGGPCGRKPGHGLEKSVGKGGGHSIDIIWKGSYHGCKNPGKGDHGKGIPDPDAFVVAVVSSGGKKQAGKGEPENHGHDEAPDLPAPVEMGPEDGPYHGNGHDAGDERQDLRHQETVHPSFPPPSALIFRPTFSMSPGGTGGSWCRAPGAL